MNLKEYQVLTQRTLPDLGEKLNLCHMVLGINSEMSELQAAIDKRDVVNIGEEIADIFWYTSNYCVLRKVSLSQIFSEVPPKPTGLNLDGNITFLYREISNLQDAVKKHVVYDRELISLSHIRNIVWVLRDFRDRFSLSLPTILHNNIEKLKVRFPDKFDKDLAKNRDLKAERTELEK